MCIQMKVRRSLYGKERDRERASERDRERQMTERVEERERDICSGKV